MANSGSHILYSLIPTPCSLPLSQRPRPPQHAPAAPVSRVVTSLTNPLIKDIRALEMRKVRQEAGLFIAEGLPAVILSVATYFYLTPGPAEARWLTDKERNWLQGTLKAESERIDLVPQGTASLRAALVNWRVLVLGLLYIGMNMAFRASTTGCRPSSNPSG